MYEIKLKEYEGPLDLLIDLIEKDKIDIYDIPISSITSKFINEIGKFEKDKENLSEFILLASTLIEIKGLMLLPKETLDEDPRINLTIMIEEYQKFKILSKKLYEYFEESSLSRTKDRQVIETTYTTVNISEDIQKLKYIYEDIIRRKNVNDNIFIDKKIIKKDEYSIIDSKNTIINKLIKNNRLSFNEILNINDPKLKIITDFFAILEIIKLNTAFIVHENGNIFLQMVKGEV